jgi:hypothetical protein
MSDASRPYILRSAAAQHHVYSCNASVANVLAGSAEANVPMMWVSNSWDHGQSGHRDRVRLHTFAPAAAV